MTSVERIKDYCDLKPEEDSQAEFMKISDDWPNKGCLELRNIYLRYDECLPYVLKAINLSISSGEKVSSFLSVIWVFFFQIFFLLRLVLLAELVLVKVL